LQKEEQAYYLPRYIYCTFLIKMEANGKHFTLLYLEDVDS